MTTDIKDFVSQHGDLNSVFTQEASQDSDLHLVVRCFASAKDPLEVLRVAHELIRAGASIEQTNAQGKKPDELLDSNSLPAPAKVQYDIFCWQLTKIRELCDKYSDHNTLGLAQ